MADSETPLSYEDARDMAASPDPAVRKKVASRHDVTPEILYFLAGDPNAGVRRTIAENTTTPDHAFVLLAKDDDDRVRSTLAQKIASLAPDISADDLDRVHKSARESLRILAEDQMTFVRQVLSDALKDVAGAPADVIKRLALDEEILVSGPVLENSPVLTDDDLLEIIQAAPAAGSVSAIAKRSTVTVGVSDAIAATDDIDAIAALISNDSAQIREETLDGLIDRAEDISLWQGPMVGRARLPSGAAVRLATFVADNLLEKLQSREDLGGDVLEEVRSAVHSRIAGGDTAGGASHRGETVGIGGDEFLKIAAPIQVVQNLKDAGKLDTSVLMKALQASDYAFVVASLCVLANAPEAMVKEIFRSRSAKGIVSLTWKANLSADTSVQLQQRMGRIGPSDILRPKPNNRYPLTDDDMEWQLEYFTNMAK